MISMALSLWLRRPGGEEALGASERREAFASALALEYRAFLAVGAPRDAGLVVPSFILWKPSFEKP